MAGNRAVEFSRLQAIGEFDHVLDKLRIQSMAEPQVRPAPVRQPAPVRRPGPGTSPTINRAFYRYLEDRLAPINPPLPTRGSVKSGSRRRRSKRARAQSGASMASAVAIPSAASLWTTIWGSPSGDIAGGREHPSIFARAYYGAVQAHQQHAPDVLPTRRAISAFLSGDRGDDTGPGRPGVGGRTIAAAGDLLARAVDELPSSDSLYNALPDVSLPQSVRDSVLGTQHLSGPGESGSSTPGIGTRLMLDARVGAAGAMDVADAALQRALAVLPSTEDARDYVVGERKQPGMGQPSPGLAGRAARGLTQAGDAVENGAAALLEAAVSASRDLTTSRASRDAARGGGLDQVLQGQTEANRKRRQIGRKATSGRAKPQARKQQRGASARSYVKTDGTTVAGTAKQIAAWRKSRKV